MSNYKHSVCLDIEKCKGCTTCLKRCPTEAIRIRNGHAVINPARCIDCGECIRVCPYKAKKAIYSKLSDMDGYKFKIALPAPSLFGQFENLDDIDYVLQGLYDMGFDDVFEVAGAAELISEYTRQYLLKPDVVKPVISSACPVIVRLISLRFPALCKNILPIIPPVELAARMAREKALKEHPELSPEDICTCFISPCPAKASYINNSETSIDFVVSVSDVYFVLIDVMNKRLGKAPEASTITGMLGIGWATTGGESNAIFNDKYLVADGIENVIKVLDQIDDQDFPDLEFVELNACNAGCVGGVMTVANPYIAKARLQNLKRYMPVSQCWKFGAVDSVPERVLTNEVEYISYSPFGSDRAQAIKLMGLVQELQDALPNIDCGSCGSPTCRALAEDIIRGEADEADCIVRMREKINDYYQLMKDRGNKPD